MSRSGTFLCYGVNTGDRTPSIPEVDCIQREGFDIPSLVTKAAESPLIFCKFVRERFGVQPIIP